MVKKAAEEIWHGDDDGVNRIVHRLPADRHGDDVDPVNDGGVEGRQDVGILVTGPADFVDGDEGVRGAALGRSVSVSEDSGTQHKATSGRREGVGAVTIEVAWGRRRIGRRTSISYIAFIEGSGSNELPESNQFLLWLSSRMRSCVPCKTEIKHELENPRQKIEDMHYRSIQVLR